MALDPFTRTLCRRMSALHPDLGGAVTDPVTARRLLRAGRTPGGPSMAEVVDLPVATDPDVRVRIYRPATGPGDLPVVVYVHGGGFVLGGTDSHDGLCRILADGTPAVVVSVDYRLAPEHPFPAASDDVHRATLWAARTCRSWGGDPARMAIAGDSAGGALAAATCLRIRDTGGPDLRAQALLYPVTDCSGRRRDVPDSLLTVAHMRWFQEQYLSDPADALHPYASPALAPDLSGLPQTFILTVEHDPLREEGLALAARLRAAEVDVNALDMTGMFHGLLGMGRLVPVARTAEESVIAALRATLGTTPQSPADIPGAA